MAQGNFRIIFSNGTHQEKVLNRKNEIQVKNFAYKQGDYKRHLETIQEYNLKIASIFQKQVP